MSKKSLWKYVLTMILSVAMIGTLTACSASEQDNGQAQPATTQETVETSDVKEETPEVQEPIEGNTEIAEGSTEGSTEESTEESSDDTAEAVEENTEEATPVEMVDFETWAKQEGNDEVCLVVWNEELGIQEIMPTFQENEEIYEIQDGDKFAIPYRQNIEDIKIDGETGVWTNTEYLEVSVIGGNASQITIIFENEEGELENINYLFE